MKRFWMFALAGLLSGTTFAQEAAASQGPVVTARDDQPVEATNETSDEDEGEGTFYIGAGVGVSKTHRSGQPKPGTRQRGAAPYVILRLGYDFADSPVSLEGFGQLGSSKVSGSGSKLTIAGAGADLLLHFDRYAAFDPFFAIGASFFAGNNAPTWHDQDRSHIFGQIGLGAFWHFSENLSLRGDYRWHVGLTDEFVSFSTVDVGLTYFFGGEEEDSTSEVRPLGPIEQGALDYDDASAHSETLVDVTPEGSVDEMKLELYLQYAKDTSIIEPTNYPALNELARIIGAALEANPDVYVTIDGHADQQYGSDHDYNQRLSEDRAKGVKTYLERSGIPAGKMKAAGHSFDQPKDPVNLKDGTPSNRRTEVVIRGVDEETRAKIRKQQ